MDSPRAQGVTGFLARAGGIFDLTDIVIQSKNEYATINVISMDSLPIASSSKILVQVVTINRLSGFETKPASFNVGDDEKGYTVDGEQIFYISNPGLGLWSTKARFQ